MAGCQGRISQLADHGGMSCPRLQDLPFQSHFERPAVQGAGQSCPEVVYMFRTSIMNPLRSASHSFLSRLGADATNAQTGILA